LNITGEQNTAKDLELQAKKMQLHWLLQITKAINYDFSTLQLLEVYQHIVTFQLKVSKLVLLVHEGQWRCSLAYGIDETFTNKKLNALLEELNQLHNFESDTQESTKDFETIIPVYHKNEILAYALIGGIDPAGIIKKNELVTFVQTITNLIVVAIENNKLTTEKIRQAGIKKELELAAQMQNMLFPKSLPSNDHYDLFATYLPNQEVGGDYYDYMPINENEFVFCMADVSGKGIPAALLMANFQANLHAFVHVTPSLKDLVKELNKRVFQSAQGEKFITFFVGKYNQLTNELQFINAGHNPPLLVHDKVVYLLNDGSTGLGMFEELPFINQGKVFIPNKALLFAYTDGLTELENDAEEQYGADRLKNLLLAHFNDNGGKLHENLQQELKEFQQNQPAVDDITALSIKFKVTSK
jgi:sigma-B regulation protein RsbU (phosphoserine phosphatase)